MVDLIWAQQTSEAGDYELQNQGPLASIHIIYGLSLMEDVGQAHINQAFYGCMIFLKALVPVDNELVYDREGALEGLILGDKDLLQF